MKGLGFRGRDEQNPRFEAGSPRKGCQVGRPMGSSIANPEGYVGTI